MFFSSQSSYPDLLLYKKREDKKKILKEIQPIKHVRTIQRKKNQNTFNN